ncbi:MAG TPA: patatin-like phospholipase family protein [Candidatus Sulfotelmatobacter sp.]|nr:patatin-like phospholipase family protein [Candidatus Sulfotelmatobacter sp.]
MAVKAKRPGKGNGNGSAAGKADRTRKSDSNKKRINLALQGGGAHGAFAWGVIDRLLDEDEIEIDGIVGTSAGAMNAAATAYGIAIGGAAGAQQVLRTFWKKISDSAKHSPLKAPPWAKLMNPGNFSLDQSPGYIAMDFLSRMFSPYQLNPTNQNPLRDVLASVIDFEAIHTADKVKLFICASNVMTGRIKVFDKAQVTVDAVLASACLPFMFQAVEIAGEHFWDGGYMGNPPLYPLFYNTDTRDILIVQLNPINIPELPTTAPAILDRINTLSFNSSLMREMRAIHFVTKLIDGGFNDGGKLNRIFIHTIDGEALLAPLGVSSKVNADWDFLMHLFENGRQSCEQFLSAHWAKIGHESSTNIEEKFF